MDNFIDVARTSQLALKDKEMGVQLDELVIKLSEECGEVSQAYLKTCSSKLTSASATVKDMSKVAEECCDVINICIAILANINDKNLDLSSLYSSKLDKWENKQNQVGESK